MRPAVPDRRRLLDINLFPAQQRAPAALFDTAFSVVGLAALAVGAVFLVLAVTLLRELRIVATDPVFAVVFIVLGVFGALGVLLDQISTVVRRGDEALRRNIGRFRNARGRRRRRRRSVGVGNSWNPRCLDDRLNRRCRARMAAARECPDRISVSASP